MKDMSNTSKILHLSDLHFGTGAREDVDWKNYIEDAEREQRLDRLKEYIKCIPTPNFVIITGDICIGCNEDGFKEFATFYKELTEDNKLPSPDCIIIVPGNHDVDRNYPGKPKQRFELFHNYIGKYYVRPWLKEHDPEPDAIIKELEGRLKTPSNLLGGIRREGTQPVDKIYSLPFLPFLLNSEQKIFIYAFNSSAVSGSRISLSEKVNDEIKWLKNWKNENQDKIINVIETLEKEIQVDPARIEPEERNIFRKIMNKLKKAYGDEFNRFLKIAVLHHHVVPFVEEEVKKFELMLNAGSFKKDLVAKDFQLILHGHKHYPDILEDTAIGGNGRLYVISGNTIGGGQASGIYPGFNLIEWKPNLSSINIKSIKLKDEDPVDIIEKTSGMEITLKETVSISNTIEEAKNAYRKDNINDAINYYFKAVNQVNPYLEYHKELINLKNDLAGRLFSRACELIKAKQDDEALKVFSNVLEIDPEFKDGNADVSNQHGNTLLHLAVFKNNEKLAKLFIANKADPNKRNGSKATPLYLAVERDNRKLVKLLIDSGADRNIKNDAGTTPLQLAEQSGFKEIIEILKKRTSAMVPISGGTFQMGYNDGKSDEKPVTEVTISNFSMGKYPVTNKEYCLFLNSQGNQIEEGLPWMTLNGYNSDKYCGIIQISSRPEKYEIKKDFSDRPAVFVSWYGAIAYCNWLSEQECLTPCYGPKDRRGVPSDWIKRNGYRLPTEAEWEYACRAGSENRYYWGDEMNDEYCWYKDNSNDIYHIVGMKIANGFGLCDMSGNVWEWCNDLFSNYRNNPIENPVGPSEGIKRIIRGGSFCCEVNDCSSSSRSSSDPDKDEVYGDFGFRIVRNKFPEN